MNYFELFGFPVAPSVNHAELAEKYFQLQRKSHPDFFTQSTEMEKEDALKLSADINKAFTIFKDQQRTLEYFLQVKGMITENEKYVLPNDFLMEMVEINEAVSESGPGNALKLVEAFEAELQRSIAPLLKESHAAKMDEVSLEKLKEYYYKKKYLHRILDRLDD